MHAASSRTAFRGAALHGDLHRRLRRQRHDDEARDRGAAALRGAGAARPRRRRLGPAAAAPARLRPPAAADVRGRGCSCATSARPAAILCYVVALANMPIADATALGQITPLLVILGASFLLARAGRRAADGADRLRLHRRADGGAADRRRHLGLCAARARQRRALRGARPGRARGCAPRCPGMVVALSAAVVVLVGAAVAHLLLEDWVAPGARHLLLLAGAGLLPDLRPLLHLHGLPGRADPRRRAVLLHLHRSGR